MQSRTACAAFARLVGPLRSQLVVACLLVGTGGCFASTLDAASTKAIGWINSQRNASDGSWGATDSLKYVQTSEAVIALAALNSPSPAYFDGIAWLSNHAPSNVDFTARRVLALGAASNSVAQDLAVLQSAQNQTAPGNNGWGLSSSYQGSPLDTALTLQAMTQQGATSGVANAVNYLVGTQLSGTDAGWALGSETTSDPTTTAQVLIALIGLQGQYATIPASVTKGLAALNAKVSTSSPVTQIALAAVANLRSNANSAHAATLLSALVAQQATDGSWGEDPYATALAMRAAAAGAGKDLATQKQVIAVPDNALRGAINAALNHGAMDALTLGQMQQLTSLNASGLGISNLTGLQYATKLSSLDVSNNNISSFTPIASLSIATLNETGNPGTVVAGGTGTGNGDVPTLPEWGAILLGGLLLIVAAKHKASTKGDRS